MRRDFSEYVPTGKQAILLERWTQLLEPTGGFQAEILQQANHQAASQVATDHLLQLVAKFLAQLS